MPDMQDLDFLIIGAAKSATTALQRALQADPQVRMPDPELHYFSREYAKGDAWYLAQFSQSSKAVCIGEKSNSYMEEPAACARIAESLPHIRLIAQLRDPVERAYSDYCMLYRRGAVGQDIATELDPHVAAENRFLKWSDYTSQLEPYFDRFGAERLLVLFYEDFRADPHAQTARVREFLGLERQGSASATAHRVKDRTAPMLSPKLKRVAKLARPVLEPLRGTPVFERLRGLAVREVIYPPLTPDLRARLKDYFAPKNAQLEALLGRKVPFGRTESGS